MVSPALPHHTLAHLTSNLRSTFTPMYMCCPVKFGTSCSQATTTVHGEPPLVLTSTPLPNTPSMTVLMHSSPTNSWKWVSASTPAMWTGISEASFPLKECECRNRSQARLGHNALVEARSNRANDTECR